MSQMIASFFQQAIDVVEVMLPEGQEALIELIRHDIV
jgi:hypothetical protein